jgi:hypothetical protein
MYETFAMLKPAAAFSLQDLERVVAEVANSGDATVSRSGKTLRMIIGDAVLEIAENSDGYVLEESNEIASRFAIACQNCRLRYEFAAEDPDMDLFNDYLLVAERLNKTGQFVIFDCNQSKLLFDGPL